MVAAPVLGALVSGVRVVALASVALAAAAAAPRAHADIYYLIVGGLGGEESYQKQFDEETSALAAVARKTAGDAAHVTLLNGQKATREALEKAFGTLRSKLKPADSLAVFLVGHGSYDGDAYKFNLPGPDITGEELGKLFAAVPARSQLIVDTTSASGAVLEPWKADGRTVITATRSGFERNATRFAKSWAAALADGSADTNKNGIITAKEAFDYASREVADSFKKAGTLATEHPQMAGDTAARFTVARLRGSEKPATPELAALDKERASLEEKIEALRGRRAQMDNDAYLNALQDLLVQLATVQGKIDAASPGGAGKQGGTAKQDDAKKSGDGANPDEAPSQRSIDRLRERTQQ